MKAKLIDTEGPYLGAKVEIDGDIYRLMDEITISEYSPKIGDNFEIEFINLIDEDESWEEMFSSNPEKKKGLEHISGWKYRAFGEIISINPVKVNCGILVEESVVSSNDPRIIGEYIGFTISRLGGYAT